MWTFCFNEIIMWRLSWVKRITINCFSFSMIFNSLEKVSIGCINCFTFIFSQILVDFDNKKLQLLQFCFVHYMWLYFYHVVVIFTFCHIEKYYEIPFISFYLYFLKSSFVKISKTTFTNVCLHEICIEKT